MLELLLNFFLMASTFTSSIFSGLPYNKSDSTIINKVAVISTPAPIKSGQDSEIQKMEMEVLSLEKQLKNITLYPTPKIISSIQRAPIEDKILIPTSKLPKTVTLTRTPSSPDTPIKSGDKIGVKSSPTTIPTKTPTPKPTNTSIPTPTPFPIPTVSKQETPVKGLNANELFSMVNDYRKSYDLPPFKKDESTCAIAQNRAPQVYDEIYGTSIMHSGLKAMKLPYYVNENIINFGSEQDAFNWWITDQIHRNAILADYNYSCIACHAYSCSEIFTSYILK